MSEWQDISTAPRDGTDILLCIYRFNNPEKGRMTVCGYWQDERWLPVRPDECDEFYPPTHWMPLPPPPNPHSEKVE